MPVARSPNVLSCRSYMLVALQQPELSLKVSEAEEKRQLAEKQRRDEIRADGKRSMLPAKNCVPLI